MKSIELQVLDKITYFFSVIAFLFILINFVLPLNANELSCIPKNNLKIPVNGLLNNITENQYLKILRSLEVTANLLAKSYGHNNQIILSNKWDTEEVNAFAFNEAGVSYVDLNGGLARYPGLSFDGMIGIGCHEIGHHLGGKPLYPDSKLSVEGQSDFYATNTCLKKHFSRDIKSNETFLNRYLIKGLDLDETYMYNSCLYYADDMASCFRVMKTAQNVSAFFSELSGDFFSPFWYDPTIVTEVLNDHPNVQCRFDSFRNGNFDLNKPRCWNKP